MNKNPSCVLKYFDTLDTMILKYHRYYDTLARKCTSRVKFKKIDIQFETLNDFARDDTLATTA